MFNNGMPRNASPGFHNPNQVIPSKRPRPEDGMPMSPRPAPGGVTGSRSQTPHQVPFPGYQGPANGAQFPQHPTPYQHLQQGASPNVTQSPIMQDFDQQSVRMGTASPSPFSPAGPHVGGPHMSPQQSDHGSRVNTPQHNNFMQGQNFPQGMNPQQFQQANAMTTAGGQPSMQAQQFSGMQQVPQGYHQAIAAQQQRLHAMQMQQGQNRQMNANPAMAGRPVPGGMNAMGNPQQMAAIRHMQQNMGKPNNPEGFMRTLQKFMMSRNLPLDPNPIASGRPINLVQLYATVMKMGGSKKVTATNMWPAVAQQLQFPQMQFPMAAQEIREHHQRNLAPYEQAFLSSQQKQFEMQQQQQQQQGGHPRQPSDASGIQFQSPSVKPVQGFEQPPQLAQSPTAGTPIANNAQANSANGFATPTHARSQSKQPQHRLSVSRQSQPSVPPDGQFPAPSPSQSGGKGSVSARQPPVQAESKPEHPVKQPIEDPFKPMVLKEHRLHGPIAVDEMYQVGEDISRLKPNVPSFLELGVIDIHAITMSLKSGIHAEVRLALDTLTTISCEPQIQISLENCDDLVESLVDCAEEQLDLLAEHTPEESDTIRIPFYEDVTRGCQSEFTSLADVSEFGTLAYELDRAVDKLICVTTVLRNFSFSESNFGILGSPPVAQFLSTIFRYLGTRQMLLRTNQNTLDFMKDAVIFLSNLAHAIQLPSKEDALSLLLFLLAFAPLPDPSTTPDKVMFTAFNSSTHRYTPAAVDGLAKLLARDDPNRTYFKAIFSGDSSGPSHVELLTRAFGLAISPIPDQLRKPLAVTDVRKVFLMQGLLAADILAWYADGSLARTWLESVDGFAIHLLRLSCLLCTERIPQIQINPRQRGQAEADAYAFSSIVHRGLAILRRLAEKSKQDNSSPLRLPSGILPKKESLLGALLLPNVDPAVVRQLVTYAKLAE
jgi:SWI/SNF chromatin-remodeling complex subunit SWI1